MKKQREKVVAAVMALFLGTWGVHRFYLGQPKLGLLYFLLSVTGLSIILGIIDGLALLLMSRERFDQKYNSGADNLPPRHRRPKRSSNSSIFDSLKFDRLRKKGKQAFDQYLFDEAEKYYLEALTLNPRNSTLLFDLACVASLKEEVEAGFDYLERAVACKFDKKDLILTHPALAFLRTQDAFEAFAKAGFRRTANVDVLEDTVIQKPVPRDLEDDSSPDEQKSTLH